MKARMKPPFRIPYWNTRQRSHLQRVPRNKWTATLSKNDAVAITVTAGSTQGQELAFLPEHLIANGYEGGTGNHAESLACDKSISFKSSLNWLNRATKKISLKTIMRKQSLLCKKCLPCTGRFANCWYTSSHLISMRIRTRIRDGVQLLSPISRINNVFDSPVVTWGDNSGWN